MVAVPEAPVTAGSPVITGAIARPIAIAMAVEVEADGDAGITTAVVAIAVSAVPGLRFGCAGKEEREEDQRRSAEQAQRPAVSEAC